MKILEIIGWLAWGINAYLAYNFASGVRNWTKSGRTVSAAGVVQAFLFLVIAIIFLLFPLNKLHIIWLIPTVFIGGNFVTLAGVPILSPIIIGFASVYKSILTSGLREELEQKSKKLFEDAKKLLINKLGRELNDSELERIILGIPGYEHMDLNQLSHALSLAIEKHIEKQTLER